MSILESKFCQSVSPMFGLRCEPGPFPNHILVTLQDGTKDCLLFGQFAHLQVPDPHLSQWGFSLSMQQVDMIRSFTGPCVFFWTQWDTDKAHGIMGLFMTWWQKPSQLQYKKLATSYVVDVLNHTNQIKYGRIK